MQRKLSSFFSKYEFVLPLIIFGLFLVAALPGIEWGAPALWNPDELIWRVDMALHGEMVFDKTEPDWNYPSLPKYVMYVIGSITYGMGKSSFAFIVTARIFSAVLGAIGGVLTYYLAKILEANKRISFLAGLFYIVSGVAVANGRFAHNDLYLQFFSILCVVFTIKYQQTKLISWLFASFFAVGLAASCKYTGGSLILLPVLVFIIVHWSQIFSQWFFILRNLILGGLIAYLGYGLGTPEAFFSPIHYFSSVIPALKNLTDYGFNFGTVIGLFGQWGVFKSAVGIFLYYFFILVLLWFAVKLFLWKLGKVYLEPKMGFGIVIFMITILIFDLPFLISINYVERYFIPFIPLLAILGALFVEEVFSFLRSKNWKTAQFFVTIFFIVGFLYSSLRLVSISLLFMNDARIPASEYIATFRGYQKSIEYTLYPPMIEKRQFERAHNYPIYFIEWADDEVPTGGRFEYNLGEQGLLERDTDYFVIDSYTYDRFYTDSICATTPVECDFFKRLLAEEVKSFYLLRKFTYDLPPYLPQVSISAVNPVVIIFERVR